MDGTGDDRGGEASAMAVPKLKAAEVKAYRERQIKRQKGICPLCHEELLIPDATLDHCHTTGHVRMALHRSCNAAEGRILHWAGSRSRGDDPLLFIRNLAEYWEKEFAGNPLHHTHGQAKRKRKRKPRMKRTRGLNVK
jgi:hypothetical protein